MTKNTTCCLTGHRPGKLPWGYNENSKICKQFKRELCSVFIGAIKYGIDTFLSGMALGFDMIGTQLLLKLKRKYKHIKIFAVIPCENQQKYCSSNDKKKYENLLKKCDKIITIQKEYSNDCMSIRNRYMVDNSSVLIACYNGLGGGTKNTLLYAQKKGSKIKIINPDDFI